MESAEHLAFRTSHTSSSLGFVKAVARGQGTQPEKEALDGVQFTLVRLHGAGGQVTVPYWQEVSTKSRSHLPVSSPVSVMV